jgi:hypothetical protein
LLVLAQLFFTCHPSLFVAWFLWSLSMSSTSSFEESTVVLGLSNSLFDPLGEDKRAITSTFYWTLQGFVTLIPCFLVVISFFKITYLPLTCSTPSQLDSTSQGQGCLCAYLPARTAHPDRLPALPSRPPRLPDKEIFKYIRVYSSIFEYIRGIFKEYSENMSSTPSLRPA